MHVLTGRYKFAHFSAPNYNINNYNIKKYQTIRVPATPFVDCIAFGCA